MIREVIPRSLEFLLADGLGQLSKRGRGRGHPARGGVEATRVGIVALLPVVRVFIDADLVAGSAFSHGSH